MAPTARASLQLNQDQISGPPWDLTSEYPSIASEEVRTDIECAVSHIEAIETKSKNFLANVARASTLSDEEVASSGLLRDLEEVTSLYWKSSTLLRNVHTFATCIASVDGANEDSKKLLSHLCELFARQSQAWNPASLFLKACKEEVIEQYLKMSESTRENEFLVKEARKVRGYSLTLKEENLLKALEVPGLEAWARLYTDISSKIMVKLESDDGSIQTMGVAKATGLLSSKDEGMRRRAWVGISNGWLLHAETCAAILNAMAAWRLEMCERRGIEHFLNPTLHRNRISRKTLDALFESIGENLDVGRRALWIQAFALGKAKLDPWDLFAPPPENTQSKGATLSFEEGVKVIAEAIAAIDTEAGKFVHMMKDRGWIDATRGNSKVPGAYCDVFAKSRNPCIYLSEYNGGVTSLLTLAHELGHAYHFWVMRDIPHSQAEYPPSLAETASIFFEIVVRDYLIKRAKSTQEKFSIAWIQAKAAATHLTNIPARFKFEYDLSDRRGKGKISTGNMDAMMVDSWKYYYGDALGNLDKVGIFFATKLHFYPTEGRFYNFPFSVGCLLSSAIYARREQMKPQRFSKMYVDFLRDTGRMTAELLVEKHIGEKIYEKQFWNQGIAIVRKNVDTFEDLARTLGYL